MNVRTVQLTKLTEDPHNARLHPERNMAAIKASLKEFGQVEPLVVNEQTGIVVGGNGRLAAMLELGWKKAKVVLVDLTQERATALGIALNRTADLAEWDVAQLEELLQGMDDYEVTGFSESELDELLEESEDIEQPAQIAEDEVPDLAAVAVCKHGELWLLGNHRLLCGDSTDADAVGKLLGCEGPRLMVTDPPYGVEYDATWREGYDGIPRHRTGAVSNDDRSSWLTAWKLAPCDVAYVWIADREAETVFRDLRVSGFVARATIAWVKQGFVFSRGHYHWQHELCWYGARKGASVAWDGGTKQSTRWDIDNANLRKGGSRDDANTMHSTQKPVECMARPMRNHDLAQVYDPFVGSGTSIVAAEHVGRQCFAMEIDPLYCDVTIERWQNLTGKKAKRA